MALYCRIFIIANYLHFPKHDHIQAYATRQLDGLNVVAPIMELKEKKKKTLFICFHIMNRLVALVR